MFFNPSVYQHWLEERNRVSNSLFGEVVGLSVKQMNHLERIFLSAINYSLYLSKQDFIDFLLHKMSQRKEPLFELGTVGGGGDHLLLSPLMPSRSPAAQQTTA